MKLRYQLTAAFTALLLVIMAVTGYVIYSLILNLLVQDEQRQLEQKGEILVSVLNTQYGSNQDIQQINGFLQDQDIQLFMYDRRQDSVLYSTMSNKVVKGFVKSNDFSGNDQLWEYGKDKFVTSRILLYPETTSLELILLTPMKDIQVIQQNFFFRLFIVFLIGAGVAVLLSYLLTSRLVTPLSLLKRQLKKIEKRQFDDIERIKASGEIKEVEQSVFEMAGELQRYMNSQQTFFQNASHELKTPLMTIQGYAEGIRDHVFEAEEEEKGLEVMVSEVKRLKTIINEMILLAKLDSEPTVYQSEKVNVRELIDHVVERVLPLVNEKGITLEHDVADNLTLLADEEKLLRALLNLVFNGVRHAKTQVRISVYKQQRILTIEIEDDGKGVAKDLRPHIFHRFVKGKDGETGLGLAIARAIVQQTDGKISVDDSELGGARFKITFPN
ncbi:signal transduction histidine kinase [Virgibacillus halotolerans]|uniref:sensor histidine kinase n=1 Tax=Virgibacillus halotolerans TaxID=1071053 RepID=UPI00195F5F23|nr:HAMP domain-containing sensor histidine kinase [Virgibacillus halotolerans]MBM7599855.1 signal transduction histidine kinase [Virgibacillus halotolerans]